MGEHLGIGIANLVNLFNPQLVVLGGHYSLAHETVIPIIKETIKRHSLFPMRTALSVLPSQRGADDSILGAVALVLEERMRAPL
jgi:predicted NBD/HSP70 family sugar kinase